MRIDTLRPPSEPLIFTPAITRAWTVGQLLDITVIGKIGENLFTLEIDHETVRTHSAEPLKPGSQFTVKVASLGSQPTLTRIEVQPSPPTASSVPISSVLGALSQALPRQQPLTASLGVIDRVIAKWSATPQKPDPEVEQALQVVREFLAASPSGRILSDPRLLASSIERCGIHLEAKLRAIADAPDSPLPTTDLKWRAIELISKLNSILRPVPNPEFRESRDPTQALLQTRPSASPIHYDPAMESASDPHFVAPIVRQLFDQLESIVSRITARQLQTIEAATSGTVYGCFELPIEINGHHCAIAIELEHKGVASPAAADAATEIIIQIPLSPVTEIRARLRLYAGDLSVSVWSNDVSVRDALIAERTGLTARLAACGFNVNHVQVAEVEVPNITRHLHNRLLSTTV